MSDWPTVVLCPFCDGFGEHTTSKGVRLCGPCQGTGLRAPFCDCPPSKVAKIRGYTKRADGTWVRPCCQRRERAAYERWGDKPIPADHPLVTQALSSR